MTRCVRLVSMLALVMHDALVLTVRLHMQAITVDALLDIVAKYCNGLYVMAWSSFLSTVVCSNIMCLSILYGA